MCHLLVECVGSSVRACVHAHTGAACGRRRNGVDVNLPSHDGTADTATAAGGDDAPADGGAGNFWTPLHEAVSADMVCVRAHARALARQLTVRHALCQPECVAFLLDHGADVDARSGQNGVLATHVAAHKGACG